MARQLARRGSVFLNVPFDSRYQPLFIALIASLVALGKRPTCVLEVPGAGATRRDRIIDHIAGCEMSIHDLSRVSLSRANALMVPRFNMPFELGLAIAISHFDRHHRKHGLVVLEERAHRLQLTLSDLNGLDPQVHGGTIRGIVRCMLNIFGGGTAGQLQRIEDATRDLSEFVRATVRASDSDDMFQADIFRQTIIAAADVVEAHCVD